MNKKIIIVTLALIIALIGGTTAFKVVSIHNDKMMMVSEKYILEQAKLCYNKKECQNESTTLDELYSLGYLEKQVNPVTKEYYNGHSYVKKEENSYTFTIVF